MSDNPTTSNRPQSPDATAAYAERLLRRAGAEHVPSGILHWSYVAPYRITSFDGVEWTAVCDQPTWQQLHLELHAGVKREGAIASPDAVGEAVAAYHARGEVPIAIADARYHTPRRRFVAQVMAAARAAQALPEPDDAAAEEILEERSAFFASALLPNRSHGFELLPHVHFGLTVAFVVPRALFLGDAAAEPAGLEVDFDDGEGFRPVEFDTRVEVAYTDELPRHVRLRVRTAHGPRSAAFRFQLAAATAPTPNQTWRLTSIQPYAGYQANGTAWVFYGAGHTAVVNPVIFADGFGEGATSLDDVWDRLNQQSLATTLLARGLDLVILGYDSKSAFLQANAFLAVACIQKAIQERVGSAPLVVGGGSMGGLVTRYALAWMEKNGRDAQTAKYLSFDTPHDGAWVPTILQYFAYYFEGRSDSARRLAALVRSGAAQQLLWGWVPSWDYSGPITTNALRTVFYAELRALGWFPSRPRKYGVANGTGNGTGNGVPAGANAFDWSGNACVGARPNIEPNPGTDQYLGEMWLGGYWNKYYATNVPAFDSCPGGTNGFFGTAGDGAAASGYGWTTIHYRTTCFVPTVSALSMQRMGDPGTNPSGLPSGLDEYTTCTSNLGHVSVTPEVKQWIVDRFAPATADEADATPAEAALAL